MFDHKLSRDQLPANTAYACRYVDGTGHAADERCVVVLDLPPAVRTCFFYGGRSRIGFPRLVIEVVLTKPMKPKPYARSYDRYRVYVFRVACVAHDEPINFSQSLVPLRSFGPPQDMPHIGSNGYVCLGGEQAIRGDTIRETCDAAVESFFGSRWNSYAPEEKRLDPESGSHIELNFRPYSHRILEEWPGRFRFVKHLPFFLFLTVPIWAFLLLFFAVHLMVGLFVQ